MTMLRGRPAGVIERAARKDVRALPPEFRDSAVAKSYIMLARRMDSGAIPHRDAATVARELRLSLMALHDMAPPKPAEDFVDEVRQQRERRMGDLAS